MTFGTARDLSSQVVAIPMTSFGMLMNSPHSEFQRISPQKRASLPRYAISELVEPGRLAITDPRQNQSASSKAASCSLFHCSPEVGEYPRRFR